MKYIVTFIFICLAILTNAQGTEGQGIEVVEFNASFSQSKCEFLEDLTDCETLRIDILSNSSAQKEHNIVVVPTLIVFSDGIEITRFQANIMMQLEVTQDVVQDAVNNAIMSSF